MSETFSEIERILRTRIRFEGPVRPETNLVADLALDSLLQLELLVELENRFAVALEPEEDREVITIGDLVAWIDRAREEDRS